MIVIRENDGQELGANCGNFAILVSFTDRQSNVKTVHKSYTRRSSEMF